MSLLKRTISALEKHAPLSLAERSWDNVGLLAEAPIPRANANKIFLTIDLTQETLLEAIQTPGVGVIISYHPPIFRALKQLTLADNKQNIILNSIAHGISIYSPHTALDSCLNGINDWIASGLGPLKTCVPITEKHDAPEGQEGSGKGRICTLKEAVSFSELVQRVKTHFKLEHVRIARAPQHFADDKSPSISTIGICAGSGSTVLSGVKADIYLTGEMSHHELLSATSDNTSVILCEHSNSERGYLAQVLRPVLLNALSDIEVLVSGIDKDPVEIV
ncbi:hypothetical protein DSO57_1008844 [Entomophthora muscae]|uniref:Uncharacterized protein n=1 Tax=Entomophthora muscae TaxID=34485 RepID=A0ACC2S900_9FUNG|nr:hypothetical protein DSO57_1008844 [Entomophthora muscae]